MKKLLLIWGIFLIAIFCTGGQARAEDQAFPYDPAMAGVTLDGTVYLSDVMAARPSGQKNPAFRSNMTGWGERGEYDIPMTLNTQGYWEGKISIKVLPDMLFEYCFRMNKTRLYIPHELVKKRIVKATSGEVPGTVFDNGGGGFNFLSYPVAKAPWQK